MKYLNNRVAEDWNGHFAAGRFLNNLFSTVHHRYALCIYTGSSIPRDGSIGGINQPSMFISLLRVFVVHSCFVHFSFLFFFFSFFLSFFLFNDAIKIHRRAQGEFVREEIANLSFFDLGLLHAIIR